MIGKILGLLGLWLDRKGIISSAAFCLGFSVRLMVFLKLFGIGKALHRQHTRQPQYHCIKVEEHLCLCSSGEFQMFPFLQIRQENKLLRKSYEDYTIGCFKPLLKEKSWVVIVGFTSFPLDLLPGSISCTHLKSNTSETSCV